MRRSCSWWTCSAPSPARVPIGPLALSVRFFIIAVAAAGFLAGCGSTASPTSNSRETTLQRTQLVQVSEGLQAIEEAVQQEVATSRSVWPLIANGLPQALPATLQSAVSRAGASIKALPQPQFMAKSSELTGPAAGIAGLYESYERLTERGWRLTETGISAIDRGTPTVASFARNNSPLYIDAIYDGHFDLSLVGKSLAKAYTQLGGTEGFGRTLPQSEVNALAAAYSIPAVRLEPHPGPAVEEG